MKKKTVIQVIFLYFITLHLNDFRKQTTRRNVKRAVTVNSVIKFYCNVKLYVTLARLLTKINHGFTTTTINKNPGFLYFHGNHKIIMAVVN